MQSGGPMVCSGLCVRVSTMYGQQLGSSSVSFSKMNRNANAKVRFNGRMARCVFYINTKDINKSCSFKGGWVIIALSCGQNDSCFVIGSVVSCGIMVLVCEVCVSVCASLNAPCMFVCRWSMKERIACASYGQNSNHLANRS